MLFHSFILLFHSIAFDSNLRRFLFSLYCHISVIIYIFYFYPFFSFLYTFFFIFLPFLFRFPILLLWFFPYTAFNSDLKRFFFPYIVKFLISFIFIFSLSLLLPAVFILLSFSHFSSLILLLHRFWFQLKKIGFFHYVVKFLLSFIPILPFPFLFLSFFFRSFILPLSSFFYTAFDFDLRFDLC